MPTEENDAVLANFVKAQLDPHSVDLNELLVSQCSDLANRGALPLRYADQI